MCIARTVDEGLVLPVVGAADDVTTTKQVDEHRKRCSLWARRLVDVEVQTVLGAGAIEPRPVG